MVITFERHPRQVLQSEWQPLLLTSLEEKKELLVRTGIDKLVVLRFDRAMSQLSSREFMERVLKHELGVSLLLTGYDNRFGHDRTATFDDYVAYGRELGIEVICGQPTDVAGQRVSSSLVRSLLSEGNVDLAAQCLGRPYQLTGQVGHGEQIGRQLGFPTANIIVSKGNRLVPAPGVYAVCLSIKGDDTLLQGMMNIGTRPTFHGNQLTLEANIFDFNGDLYGQHLNVFFIERLRNEQAFSSAEALMEQMEHDAVQAREILSAQHITR
jgi:riboflavin kinase/FMN adenylyltransferase